MRTLVIARIRPETRRPRRSAPSRGRRQDDRVCRRRASDDAAGRDRSRPQRHRRPRPDRVARREFAHPRARRRRPGPALASDRRPPSRFAQLPRPRPRLARQPARRTRATRSRRVGPFVVRERVLELGDRRVDGQSGRRGECSRRGFRRHDRQLAVARRRLPREQSEVDARRRHSRPARQDDRQAAFRERAHARRRRGDLVVDVEVDDRRDGRRRSSHLHRPQHTPEGGVERVVRCSGARSPGTRGRSASRPAGPPGVAWRRSWPRSGQAP